MKIDSSLLTNIRQNVPLLWFLSIPILLVGYGCSVFFVGTDSPLLAPAMVCLFAVSLIGFYPNFKQGWELPSSFTFVFVMMFGFWIWASTFWSTIPYVSTTFAIILAILPGFFAVCIMAHDREKFTNFHVGALWFALLAFGVWALIQFFFFYEQYGPRIKHPMLNPNNLAGLFNMGVFPALAMFFIAKDRTKVILTGLAVAIFYAALVVTQSRGGYYSCIVSAVAFLPFVLIKNPDGMPWKKVLFVVAMAFLIPMLGNIYNEGSLSENLVGVEQLTNTRSLEDRFYLWESTAKMIKDHPWLGTGLATFYFYYPRYRLPTDRSDGFFSHMDPLQFWAEMGIMAPILFYGALICILLRTIAATKKAGPDMKSRLQMIGPFCGMLALTGHTHLTFHLYMPGILIPLSGLLAYWYLTTERVLQDERERTTWKPEGRMKWLAPAGCALIIILVAGWIARTSLATHLIRETQEIAAKGNQQAAMRKLSWAGIVAPGSFARTYEYEARFRVSQIWDGAKNMEPEQLRKLYDEAMYFLDEAQSRNAVFTTLWDLRARTYYAVDGIILTDGKQQAVKLLQKVIDVNPMAAESRIGLANMYIELGDAKRATYVLESGLQWPRPRGRVDLNYLLTLARLKMQAGDKQAHDRYFEEAKRRAVSYGMVVK